MVFPGASLGITPTVQTASVASLTGCRKLCLAHIVTQMVSGSLGSSKGGDRFSPFARVSDSR